jgi:NAD(P)-dependent dehydrogenase (short-subunit alcohol dehydrogenase family)
MLLKDKVSLITGGGRGIGRSIAFRFAREGARVAILGRNREQIEAVAGEISQTGMECLPVRGDISRKTDIMNVFENVRKHLGNIHILVNNAGLSERTAGGNPSPVVSYDDQIWEKIIRVNLTGTYLCTKAVLPGMIQQRYGRVINISSIGGRIGMENGAGYSASKHAILGFTKSLALEVARYGITANVICPGPVNTETLAKRIDYLAAERNIPKEQVAGSFNLQGRLLDPDEIAVFTVFLASDLGKGITGETITIAGGMDIGRSIRRSDSFV